ncbi:MAG TPA: alanine racemase [Candidatus Nanopelagicaceae bacterium]
MRAFVQVDLEAIAHNIQQIKSGTNAKILAVVKADAYGHGLVPVATRALEVGATYLGTALLEEAVALRAVGITAPIIAWLTPPGEDFTTAIKLNIDLSVSSIQLFEEILGKAKELGIKPRLHFEVDTGMRRGGVLNQWDDFIAFALEHRDEYTFVGFWSHFARADEPESSFNANQQFEFENKLTSLKAVGFVPEIIHLSNSAASLSIPSANYQMIRLGIAMYGLSPDVNAMGPGSAFNLRPAMSIKAQLHLIKDAKAGDAVGYGGTEILTRDTKLGIVVIGYSDGLPRSTSNKVGVSYEGRKCPLVGRISMDQCVVDLGPDSKARAGDYVTVMGGDGYTIDEWATAANTINYEIVTRIASRLPRIYS